MAANRKHHLTSRGGIWYFIAKKNGKRYHQRLSANLKEAIKLRDDYLYELNKFGAISSIAIEPSSAEECHGALFGEVVTQWAEAMEKRIRQQQIKASTMRDYRSTMNAHFLPKFGNTPIRAITSVDIEDYISDLECSAKRINNLLVPMRDIFKMAKKRGYVDTNIMLDVDNLRTVMPDVFPMTPGEVQSFLQVVPPHYEPFFTTAFFTGMRFGEMAALKWHNLDWNRGLILVRETRVYGVEGLPKTKGSVRDIEMLPVVRDALERQQAVAGKGPYVFRDSCGNLMNPDHVRNVVWTPTLKLAGLRYRPMMQTRHTFATIAIDSGEDLGWVQSMMGHSSLQMIYTRYYSWVRKSTRNDGSAMMSNWLASTGAEQG
jgi:integrase